ncbi:hypothetical protein E2C01_018291 [Portunus trituberculatus]|uniref:Uncharacterized protein n=1 Tax=Portunus trituberculatus TaxID=210409 RepID=A0A5B7DUR2_PORTR|nr:hypothetical protein [Portunus trituberculatus]
MSNDSLAQHHQDVYGTHLYLNNMTQHAHYKAANHDKSRQHDGEPSPPPPPALTLPPPLTPHLNHHHHLSPTKLPFLFRFLSTTSTHTLPPIVPTITTTTT